MRRLKSIAAFFVVLFLLSDGIAQEGSYQKFVKAYAAKDFTTAAVHGAVLQKMIDHPDITYKVAEAYAQTGETEKALTLLANLAQRGLAYAVATNPNFHSLASNQSFQQLKTIYNQHRKPVQKATTAFRLQDSLMIPESMAYHDGFFYVGSLSKNKIIRYKDGKEEDFFKNDSVLYSVTGMKVDPSDGSLWVCSFNENGYRNGWSSISQIDLRTGKLLKHVVKDNSDGPHLFNDLVLVGRNVYFTDSKAGKLYRLNKGSMKMETVPSRVLIYPNGITRDKKGENLYLADYAGLYRLHLPSGKLTTMDHQNITYVNSIDGLYYYKGTLVAIQNLEHGSRVAQFTLNGQGDLKGVQVLQAADADFDTPTTGVIAGDAFYFIANSFVFQLRPDGSVTNAHLVKRPLIKKINLQ